MGLGSAQAYPESTDHRTHIAFCLSLAVLDVVVLSCPLSYGDAEPDAVSTSHLTNPILGVLLQNSKILPYINL